MASDSTTRLGRACFAIGTAVLALCLLAAIAGRVADGAQAARWLTGLGLLALAPLALLAHGMRRLQHASLPVQSEIPPAMPLPAQALTQTLLQLEAQLQHAPVALFLIRERHAAAMDQTPAHAQANSPAPPLPDMPVPSPASPLPDMPVPSPASLLPDMPVLSPASPLPVMPVHSPANLPVNRPADSLANSQVQPLNASARRLLAPGRASDVPALRQQLLAQRPDQRGMLGFEGEQGHERALVASSALVVAGEAQRLVALMPVESELEAEALKAWRQLVHVLTHEIMNSLTPVASLSRTALDLVEEVRPQLDADVADDLATALDAISRRAGSLEKFVSSYRNLSNLPASRPEVVELAALFARLSALVAPQWQARNGKVSFVLEPESLQIMCDGGQLEQALINLLKNALEAAGAVANPQAQVSARLVRGGRLRIDVQDNGPGVPDELVAHIFTPFFTTKEQGGGIGLAMVRQLVHGNGGTVRYAKSVQGGARFVLTF